MPANCWGALVCNSHAAKSGLLNRPLGAELTRAPLCTIILVQLVCIVGLFHADDAPIPCLWVEKDGTPECSHAHLYPCIAQHSTCARNAQIHECYQT